jgi:hypothetical protein
VPITVSGFSNVTSLQFTLGWDPKVLEYAGAEESRLGQRVTLTLETLGGRSYLLEVCDSLTPSEWRLLKRFTGQGGLEVLVDEEPGAAQRFYRVRMSR